MCFDRYSLFWFCAGAVSTLAGSGGGAWADGVGLTASFYYPFGVSVDSNGACFVTDQSNHRIQKINAAGEEWVIDC